MQHKEISQGHWQKLNFFEQMANVGSEIIRAINWNAKGNEEYCRLAFYRGIELLDLTIADAKNNLRLKEIVRLREVLADYFAFDNTYQSTAEAWQKYFLAFNWAANRNK